MCKGPQNNIESYFSITWIPHVFIMDTLNKGHVPFLHYNCRCLLGTALHGCHRQDMAECV